IEKFKTEIDKLQSKQKALSEKIQEHSGGKDEFYAKKAELRAQLDELSGKIDVLQARKEEINRAVGSKRDEEREKRNTLNTMKKSIVFSSEADIDNRIASIEFQLCTESVPLKEEKKLLAEIQQLKKNRSKVSHMQQMEQNPSTVDPTMSMKEQKDVINEEMNRYRDEKRKIQ
ncbi:CPK2, partial [Symbiodinium necroappetens]